MEVELRRPRLRATADAQRLDEVLHCSRRGADLVDLARRHMRLDQTARVLPERSVAGEDTVSQHVSKRRGATGPRGEVLELAGEHGAQVLRLGRQDGLLAKEARHAEGPAVAAETGHDHRLHHVGAFAGEAHQAPDAVDAPGEIIASVGGGLAAVRPGKGFQSLLLPAMLEEFPDCPEQDEAGDGGIVVKDGHHD